jgi:hypothetical protein
MEKPFFVQVYTTIKGRECYSRGCYHQLNAFYFARDVFKLPEVYKVKVWDLRISEPVPNVADHPALLLHLV